MATFLIIEDDRTNLDHILRILEARGIKTQNTVTVQQRPPSTQHLYLQYNLDEREIQIIEAGIGTDWDYRIIARMTGYAEQTVRKHFQMIYKKLGVKKRSDMLSILYQS